MALSDETVDQSPTNYAVILTVITNVTALLLVSAPVTISIEETETVQLFSILVIGGGSVCSYGSPERGCVT